MKIQSQHIKHWDIAKVVLREKLTALNAYSRKEHGLQSNNISLELKKLEN